MSKFNELYESIINESIEFKDEYVNYYSGQYDYRINAIENGEVLGYIDYTDYNDEISIKYIEVNPKHRRKGIGEQLVLQLQKKYPKTEIDWGMTTDDGTKLYNKIKNKLYVDKARLKKIASLKAKFKKNKAFLDKSYKDKDPKSVNWDKVNDIQDEQDDIESELWIDYGIDINE
jgi:GNAT superfamily N-acetyltransferase